MTLQVVIPAYNCFEWIPRCLASVAIQTYKDYDVVVVDDASTVEPQPMFIEHFCKEMGWRYRLNTQNMGAGYNIYTAIHDDLDCGFDDPILLLDGDDFLPHEGVFARINEIYEDPDVWIMWTNYEPHPHSTGQTQSDDYPADVKRERSYRKTGNYANHMLTFRSFLFQEAVTPRDLKNKGGDWAVAGYDRMIMVPMMEMGGAHSLYVPETLYMYNAVNPISDVFVRLKEAQAAHKVVASLPVKDPILDAWVDQQRAGNET